MFSYHTRQLAFVPRWQIAPRFRTQTVAEHSYYVALYVMELLYLVDWPAEWQQAALECAIKHDVPEYWTGDMPGPIKRQLVDKTKLKALEDEAMEQIGIEPVEYPEEIVALVKVADLIDEAFHIATEIAMGNSLIRRQFDVTWERFCNAVTAAKLPYEVVRDVENEIEGMKLGVDLPRNDAKTDPLTTDPWGLDEEIPF